MDDGMNGQSDLMRRVSEGDLAGLERAMMIGLAREQAPGRPLDALALLGARLGFARPSPPTGAERSVPPRAARAAYLPDEARRPFVALANGKSADDALPRFAARAARRAGLALHPFDFVRIEEFIARWAHELGPEERAWIAAVQPRRKAEDEPYADGPIDEASLPKLSRPQKLDFLRPIRAVDPARARALIAALLPHEPAHARGDLIGLLAIRLSPDDRETLEAVAQDRAASVRATAEKLLARLPGTDAFARRVERLRECLSIETSGLLRRTKKLKYLAKPNEAASALFELLDGLTLADVAAALGETPDALMAAAEAADKAGLAPLHLYRQAAVEDRIDLLDKHQAILDDHDAETMIVFFEAVWPSLGGPTGERLLDLSVRPKSWWRSPYAYNVRRFVAAIDRALPETTARRALDMRSDPASEDDLVAIAPLIPPALSRLFVERFETQARLATLYHHFLLALPDAPQTRI
jgi:hypothetical protein